MIDRRAPSDKVLSRDAATIEQLAGGTIDVAIVLGTGLSTALHQHWSFTALPYDRLLGIPVAPLLGHAGEVMVGVWRGKRVAAFAGRVHLYQGFSAQQVTATVRLAAEAGAGTILLTNAAGAMNEGYAAGDLMLISDQLNLTGHNPLVALPQQNLFLDCSELYSERLRAHMRAAAGSQRLHEGVYAGLLGPTYETPAEARWLRTIGADAVGMSTVLEAIVAKYRGLNTVGISVITNQAGAPATGHDAVNAAAVKAGDRLAELIDAFLMHV